MSHDHRSTDSSVTATGSVMDSIVDELTDRFGRGEQPDLEEYLTRYPHLCRPLREVFETLVALHVPGAEGVDPHTADEPCPLPGRLGDFRLLREIGRGGMGVVYEAEQISLRRRVALKVLPFAAVLDPRHLQRFKNEAQAAASLDHPNIVGIHSVGCERGVHYYAMQYIEGPTLATVIGELRLASGRYPMEEGPGDSSDRRAGAAALVDTDKDRASGVSTKDSVRSREFFRATARLGIQAAEALEHAHQMGVVHRDVKPSNLMVDPGGHLWVADFGLAMVETAPDLTMTGDVLGTLRYMSPEQLEGDHHVLDHRTDIYSLGVTLYELIALQPPFDGEDRKRLLARIAAGDPPAPSRHNPAVPRDLETIVLKAMAKEPRERYGSAREMAEDLQRFLDHRPILARRPSLVARVAKWSGRHRSLVLSSIVFLLLGTLGLAVASAVVVRQRNFAVDSLRVAEEAQGRERQAAEQARRAVDTMYTKVAQTWLADQPGLTRLQREFLESALKFYEGFAQRKDVGGATRFETAKAYQRCGEVRLKLGDLAGAEAAFQEAIRRFQVLAEQESNAASRREELAASWFGLAQARRDQSVPDVKPSDRFEAARRALALRRELARENPDNARYREALCQSHTALGESLATIPDFEHAQEHLSQAKSAAESLAAEFPEVPRYRDLLAEARSQMAWARALQGRLGEAWGLYTAAIDDRSAVLKSRPRNMAYRNGLAKDYRSFALLLRNDDSQRDQSEALYRQAITAHEDLVRDYPDVPELHEELATDWGQLADLKIQRGNWAAAQEPLERSVQCYRDAAVANPRDVTCSVFFLLACRDLMVTLDRLGKHTDMRSVRGEAIDQLDDVLRAGARHARLAEVCDQFAGALLADPDPEFRDASAAMRLAEKAVKLQSDRAASWRTLGIARYRGGEWAGAIEALEKSIELRPSGAGPDYLVLAMAQWQAGRKEQARTLYDKGAELIGRDHAKNRHLARFRAEAAELLGITDERESKK